MIKYKFKEDKIIKEVKKQIDKTYTSHYGNGKYQATDMIIDAGHGESFSIGNIMKYAMRFGGVSKNKQDLIKIIHYAIIALYIWRKKIMVDKVGVNHT